jgi:hypothetical protein
MARNGHMSAFSGLVLSGAHPVYVDPVYDGRRQVAHGVDPAVLESVLDAHPEARALMVFTPLLLRRQRGRPRACLGVPLPRHPTDDRRRLGSGLLLLQPAAAVGDRVRRRPRDRQRAQDAQRLRPDVGAQPARRPDRLLAARTRVRARAIHERITPTQHRRSTSLIRRRCAWRRSCCHATRSSAPRRPSRGDRPPAASRPR